MPMNNTFPSTKEEWKRLANIDYFGMYVKAYIPFNAWMNLNFADDSDRAMINAIKRGSNDFRNKIVALLQDDTQEGADFRARLGELHNALEQAQLANQGRIISFHAIRFKNEGDCSLDADRHSIHFHVHCGDVRHPFETYEYDTKKVSQCVSQLTNEGWRQKILTMYKSVAPLIEKDLVTGRKNEEGMPITSIECGRFYFLPDVIRVTQGLIEVLYNLRNALFHGEINPNGDANKVYGAAYHILRCVIECL